MKPYAAGTLVPVSQSRNEIEKLMAKFGADQFGYSGDASHAHVMFRARNRVIRFTLPLPNVADYSTSQQRDQAIRSAWRALVLSIKAKVVAVESQIITFEEEFLPFTVMPDGHTVAEHTLPHIADAYAGRDMPRLLPNFRAQS